MTRTRYEEITEAMLDLLTALRNWEACDEDDLLATDVAVDALRSAYVKVCQ